MTITSSSEKGRVFFSSASGSEFKENYCYWTRNFSDIISLLCSNSESPIREVDTLRIKKNKKKCNKFFFVT